MTGWVWVGWALADRAGRVAVWRVQFAVARVCVRLAGGSRLAQSAEEVEQIFVERRARIGERFEWQLARLRPGMGSWYRAWQRRRRVDLSEPWTLGAVSMADTEPATRRRSEFYGMNSPSGADCYDPLTDEDNYLDTLGTSANPYRSPSEVGTRRRR